MVSFPKFKAFAEETKLHGITRVAEGRKASMAMWAVLFTICVAMAIRDLYYLIDNYQSEPTAIQMTLSRLPEDFNWTTPTLCMDMIAQYDKWGSEPFDKPEYMKNNFSAVINMMLSQLYSTVNTANYTEIQYNSANNGVWGLTDPNSLYYFFMVLGYLTDLERQLMNQSRLNDYQFSLAVNGPLIDENAQQFYNELYRQNASMSTLTQLVGMWFCLMPFYAAEFADRVPIQIFGHMENYRYYGDPQYIDLPMCKANMITHLGFGMVCSKLFETDYVPLKPKYNYFAIYDTRLTFPGVLNSNADLEDMAGKPAPAKGVPNLLFHLDLQGRNVIPTDDHTNIFSWSPADNVVLDISVSAEYQFLNTKKRKCSASPVSQADCIWQKRVEYVHQTCGCWPSLADIRNPKNGLNCISSHLNNISYLSPGDICANIKSSSAPDLSECVMDCHLLNYSFTQHRPNRFPYAYLHSRTFGSGALNNVGSFEFRFGADSHPFVSEYYTTKASDFLGLFGGSIGTWLGASLLAFVHLVVFILRQFGNLKSKAKQTEAEESQSQIKLAETTKTVF